MKTSVAQDLKTLMQQKNGGWEFEGPTIIYCPTKKAAEETENIAKSKGLFIVSVAFNVSDFSLWCLASLNTIEINGTHFFVMTLTLTLTVNSP